MKILLANPRGFCAGVEMAIETVAQAIEVVGTPLYVYHEIVHNRHVVERFEAQGVVFIDTIEEAPQGSTVVFSAHGVSPAVREAARTRGCTLIDATCPLVTKVHMEAVRYARSGHRILLIGHAGHDEVEGTFGEAPHAITIVESPEDVEKLPFSQDVPLVYLTQTTLSVDDAERIIGAIRKRYPLVKAPPTEDICYATTNRQGAVRLLAPLADVTIVVGSTNSSNSVRLTEISQTSGTPAYLIDDRTELQNTWFKGVETVLLTAGASAPEDLIAGVIEELQQRYNAVLEQTEGVKEEMSFSLPRSLRVLQNQVGRGA